MNILIILSKGLGYKGQRTMKIDRKKVYDKCNGKCAYCGHQIEYKAMQVDHITPRCNWETYSKFYDLKYDVDSIDNLNPSCRSCNLYKSGNPLEIFRKELQRQPEILKRDRPTVRLAERFGLLEFKPQPIVFYFEK